MSEELFRKDAYLRTCDAKITSIENEGIIFDKTIFYPLGGGQPGDTGVLYSNNNKRLPIVDTRREPQEGKIIHITNEEVEELRVGETMRLEIDWDRRYRLMKMHSALHLLCAVVKGGVTGGHISEKKSRLDFDLKDTLLDRDHVENSLNELVRLDLPLTSSWITDEELVADKSLIRTMSVKPPTGLGILRLVEIKGVDLQPCGGTHVNRTIEIGQIKLGKIENKGKQNRRINIHLSFDCFGERS